MANETGCTYDNGNGNKLSARAAAFEVLKKARKPLHCSEITRRVLGGRLAPGLQGKTPGATIQASLAVENARPDGVVKRTAPGTYILRETWRQNALLRPVDPAMMQLSKVELVKYSETGEAQAEAAGLELLRRATNRVRRTS